jgi:VWFA-related protein
MRVHPLFLPALFLASACAAQTPAPQPAPEPVPTFRTGTQLVIVDVNVIDAAGNPVHGLQRDDFTLTEKKQPQTIRNFEEHSKAQASAPGPSLGPMPPGTFTDYTPTPPSGALNILLLDALNTPMSDQAYVRYELQQYVKSAQPGTRVAIFGLSSRLFLLQGFTSDPEVLRDAVQHKLIPRASNLLDDPTGSGVDTPQLSDMAADMGPQMAEVASNLQQFEAETQAFQTQLRVQYTVDAFNTLGHYLSAFPGRKNLIWFSGSFPIDIMPDPSLNSPFNVMYNNDELFRETTNLLARAQVAVYPVDARGLMTNPMFSAANSGRSFNTGPKLAAANAKFFQSQAAEHSTMDEIANETGGHAFYNNNDLANAVRKAIDAGSNYYTVTYTPTNHKWDGGYRDIRVALAPKYAAAGYKLTYRRGYYADDPNNPKAHLTPVTTTGAVESAQRGPTYVEAALSHGSPEPEEILFKVRVLPATTGTEDTLAVDNTPDPKHPIKPPFRRFLVDFASLNNAIELTKTGDGHHAGKMEFSAFLFDSDGRLLNATGRTLSLNLTDQNYAAFLRGATKTQLQISAPVKGETYLRVGIHDVTSNRVGAVEIPLSKVAKLAPPPEAQAPPPAAATPPAAGVKSPQPPPARAPQ